MNTSFIGRYLEVEIRPSSVIKGMTRGLCRPFINSSMYTVCREFNTFIFLCGTDIEFFDTRLDISMYNYYIGITTLHRT